MELTDPSNVGAAEDALSGLGSVRSGLDGESVELHVEHSGSALVEAVRRLDAATLEPAAMTVREPSLDDVFLELTGKPPDEDFDNSEGGPALSTTALSPAAPAQLPSGLRLAVMDAITMTWRNLRGMTRVPEVIVFSTIQPIIFVLTFRYVFGGAINTGPVEYVDFLMPGIFVQTVAFGAMNTGIGLAEDLAKGLIERFRSLPMARSAVLAGRTLADVVRNLLVVLLMIVVGFMVGFDIYAGWPAFGAAVLLLLAFGYAMSWVFAFVALSVPNAEAAQAASFPILAVLVFASNAFVPVETMPGWLQAYNEVNPVSITVTAVRALCLGGETLEPVLKSLACIALILAIFGPVAVAKYRRAV